MTRLLLVAVSLFVVNIVLTRLLYVGSRMRPPPWWANETMSEYVLIPAVVCMLAFAIGFGLRAALHWQTPGLVEAGAMLAIVSTGVGLWKLIGRAPAADAPRADNVVPMPRPSATPTVNDPDTSASRTGPPRKAA